MCLQWDQTGSGAENYEQYMVEDLRSWIPQKEIEEKIGEGLRFTGIVSGTGDCAKILVREN